MFGVIRVLVADDQATVRDGLVTILSLLADVEVVAAVGDGEEAVAAAVRLRPDVALMDLRMPVVDGVEATRRIGAAAPGTAVLVLTTYADDESIFAALRAGARGYLTKDAGRADIAAALASVAAGQSALAPSVADRVIAAATTGRGVRSPGLRDRFPQLTAREAEVLELIVAGRTNPEIAAALFVSVATVKTHVNALFAKLAVTDRRGAIAVARGAG